MEYDTLICRPRLLEKISPQGVLLTYIHADAGYGKTTLLMQYARGRHDVVWLSLDSKDNDILFFLQHLESLARENLTQFEFHTTDYIPFVQNKNFVATVLPPLLQAMEISTLTFILDDVHIITNVQLIDLLTEWVKRCPPSITLVMASRHELWSSLYRLKTAGRVAELTKIDLSFSQEEAEMLWGFFDEEAYSATEGWTLAIQSYRLAADGNKQLSISKPHADRDLCRYLLNEIFVDLSPEVQHFLKATSWLPELEISKCDILLGINNSQMLLEELIHQNLFTQRISTTSYRYHTLFRTFLQQNDEGLGQKTLHDAMVRFYDRGDYEQAAEYALLVKDERIIQDCIGAIAGGLFGERRILNLRKYFDFLKLNPTELTPRVQLLKGIYLSERGDFYQAEKCLKVGMSQLNSEDKNLYLHAMIHKARVLRNRVSFEESNCCIETLLPLLEDDPMQWYWVVIEKIHNLTLTSYLSAALELTISMMEKCLMNGDLKTKRWFERYLSAIYFYRGDYKNCIKFYEKSLSIPQEEQDRLMRHCVGVYAAKAYQIAGQEEKALPLLNSELNRMRQRGLHEEYSITYLFYAEILHTEELLKFYQGEAVNFSVSDQYLSLAEEYAVLNRSTRDHLVFVKVWKNCAALLQRPNNIEEYINDILTMMKEATPFFQTLAYGRIANALQVLEKSKDQYKEFYEKSIEIGESIESYSYATIAYGKLAALYQEEGKEGKAKEYARRFMELSAQNDHRYYFRFKPLFATVLKLVVEWGITPEFTREMLDYGGYKTKRVYINTMGTFYIAPFHDKKNPIKIRTLKARELLAYLLEHREGVNRDKILSELWWDSESNVTSLFHTRRGEIKQAFESMGASNPIRHVKGVYRLDRDVITCDFDAFQQAATVFQLQPNFADAQKVVELYTGRYLNDFEALWAESTRLKAEEVFLAAVDLLLGSYAQAGDKVRAAELVRQCTRAGVNNHKIDNL